MSRFKVKNERELKTGDSYLDLQKYLKNKQIVKLDNEFYYSPRFIKSKSGEHTFEIYEQIDKELSEHIKDQDVLYQINKKLDVIIQYIKK